MVVVQRCRLHMGMGPECADGARAVKWEIRCRRVGEGDRLISGTQAMTPGAAVGCRKLRRTSTPRTTEDIAELLLH